MSAGSSLTPFLSSFPLLAEHWMEKLHCQSDPNVVKMPLASQKRGIEIGKDPNQHFGYTTLTILKSLSLTHLVLHYNGGPRISCPILTNHIFGWQDGSSIGMFYQSEWGNQPSSFWPSLRWVCVTHPHPGGISNDGLGGQTPFDRETHIVKECSNLEHPVSPKIHPSIGPLFISPRSRSLARRKVARTVFTGRA